MMDRNKQTEVQTEVSYLTLSEFLQSTPPNQWRYISALSVSQHVGAYASVSEEINKCKLELYCSNDLCNGFRFFVALRFFQAQEHIYEKIVPIICMLPINAPIAE